MKWIMRAGIIAFILFRLTSNGFGMVTENGTLRGFLLGHCPGCSYDNWVSHVSEGIAKSGLNDYGPSFFDPQKTGFGSFTLIPSGSSGDQTILDWRNVFTAAIQNEWLVVDSMLTNRQSVWRYELVALADSELNKTFHILRERLDSSYVDANVDTVSTDNVVGSFRNGWGVFVFNPSPQLPKLIIEMPHPEDDFISLPVGIELFIETGAEAMMIAGAGREVLWDTSHTPYINNYSLSDPSRNCRCPFAEGHETFFDLLDGGPLSPLVTVQIHSYDTQSHPNLSDAQVSAFADDNKPNPPLRDRTAHQDLIHYMGQFPVQGLTGYPSITRRIDQYVSLYSSPAYAYYAATDTIAIPSIYELVGAVANCQGVYSHRNHNINVDPENFIHAELDEYPDGLWSPTRWIDWLPGSMPATWETFRLALEYYHPFIAAMDSSLRYYFASPDTIPPLAVLLTEVVPIADDSVYLHWSPQAADGAFDTYQVFYDTVDITGTSPSVTRLTSGMSALGDYQTTSIILSGLTPPLSRYWFAVGSHDLAGNQAVRSPSSGITPGPFVLTRSVQINDSTGGNGNGIVDYGETLAIKLSEENTGDQAAHGVTVRISSPDRYFTIIDSLRYFGTILPGQRITNPIGFEALVATSVPDSHAIPVNVIVTDSALNEWPYSFTILARSNTVKICTVSVTDTTGNRNGVMDAGENVTLNVQLCNSGSVQSDSLVVTFTSDNAYLSILQPTVTLPLLLSGQSVYLTPISVQVLSTAPAEDHAFFYAAVSMIRGRTEQLLFELPISGFSDLVESGQGSWTHHTNHGGWSDQWHISTELSHSPTHAWKCGSTGTSTYANHMDAVLLTPTINLTGHEELRFWHWMDAEVATSYPDSAYDAGIVELSVAGGDWQQLIPSGGYNKHVRCVSSSGGNYSGPFTGRTPCFGGTIPWTEVVCDLGAYSGQVQIRFRFGSDNSTAREGWYVDNVQILRMLDSNAPRNLQAVLQETEALLTWQSPTPTLTTSMLSGYNIYRDGIRIDSLIQALTYRDAMSSLPFGIYTYAVSAQYADSESVLSNSAIVQWAPPADSVTNLTIQYLGQNLILNWTPTDADYYRVISSDSPDDFTNGTVIEVTQPPVMITGDLAQFGWKFYTVVAVRN